jgi:tRNA (Thr-GGU) A37 N-methylase
LARPIRAAGPRPLVGIFAQRGKNRPNRIGVTVCGLVAVNDLTVEVESLDALDGTPVLDIKPYMPEFAPRGGAAELMSGYWGNSL